MTKLLTKKSWVAMGPDTGILVIKDVNFKRLATYKAYE